MKLSERRAHSVYFYLYKSKYSTMNIQFSYLNFKHFHLHVQNNVRNCVQHKKKKKKKKAGTSPAYQEVMCTGTGPRPGPWVQVQSFVPG